MDDFTSEASGDVEPEPSTVLSIPSDGMQLTMDGEKGHRSPRNPREIPCFLAMETLWEFFMESYYGIPHGKVLSTAFLAGVFFWRGWSGVNI